MMVVAFCVSVACLLAAFGGSRCSSWLSLLLFVVCCVTCFVECSVLLYCLTAVVVCCRTWAC